MKLREIDFGNILGASGVQGFFGEGYWFHKLCRLLGWSLDDITFVSKTATLLSREGNMELKADYTPRDLFPDCVKVKARKGVMLNSVGLSNPGLGALLGTGKWQKRTKPFLISLMSLAKTPEQRFQEMILMVELLRFCRDDFAAPFGLQINLSCPNTGHNPAKLIDEAAKMIEIAGRLGVPVMPKFSIATASIEALVELGKHPSCNAICVSNTLPFGWEGIDWQKVWGTTTSPLAHIGGGGLSGKQLRPLVCAYITRLREAGITKPINGGGGIFSAADVRKFYRAGANSIFIGSVASLRPWQIKPIINQTNNLIWE